MFKIMESKTPTKQDAFLDTVHVQYCYFLEIMHAVLGIAR